MNNKLAKHYQEIILHDGAYYSALLNDINAAQKSIDIEVYIFRDDIVGQQLADALINAAKRHVKVRVLVDGAGSLNWGGTITREMEKAGIVTQVFHPFPWKIFSWIRSFSSVSFKNKLMHLFSNINKRNHRKSCIIDDRIVYIGSANIAKCHECKDKGGDDWRDTTVKLVDVNTQDLQQAFNRAWDFFTIPERIQKRIQDVFREIDPHTVFQLNYSRHQRHIMHRSLLRRIALSKQRIWVTNAYFVPDAALLKGLIRASRRGVDVRILLPAKSDIFVMPLVSATFYTNLLKNGVKIFEYLPSMLHAKILIIDDWFSLGSSNLNHRSLIHDLEVNVLIHSDEAKRELENQFLKDLQQSKRIELIDLTKLSFVKRIMGRLLLYVKYFM